LFPESFNYGWIVDEIAPNLPKELDFILEGKNSEKACVALRKVGITEDHCIIPKVKWEQTSHRVLSMEFEEGFPSTDVEKMKKHGLSTRDVAKAISSVFNSQVFTSGFVHCDPHPANVLVRCHPQKNGKPQLVLVDHGLYKQIDDEFRVTYAQLWKALLLADIPQIKISCEKLGVKEMVCLLFFFSFPFFIIATLTLTWRYLCYFSLL
jgi:aarF domain-containing kinase